MRDPFFETQCTTTTTTSMTTVAVAANFSEVTPGLAVVHEEYGPVKLQDLIQIRIGRPIIV